MTEREFFEKNRCYKITPEGSINTRCPFCGDSQKPHHLYNYGQAYIFKDGYFKCFRCGKYTTAKEAIIQIAINLGIQPPEEIINKFKVTSIKYIMKSQDTFTYYKPTEQDLHDYSFKIKYLKNRTYFDNIDLDFIENNKIILNLDPYHEKINAKFKNIKPNDYIGFMTYNNKKIVLRRIDNENRYRYLNLSVSNEYDFWTCSSFREKLFKTKTVIVGEGIFDVLNKNTQSLFNGTYVASLSKGSIISTIKKIFVENLIRFNVIILKDRDVDINFLKYIKRSLNKYLLSFTIYENLAGKDFGEEKVIPNKIIV